MTSSLPLFVQEMLNAPPRAGEGVHGWLYRVARQLHARLPAGEIVNLLENRVQGCGRLVGRTEIEDAVKNSIPCAWTPKGHAALAQSAPKWPPLNKEQRDAILRDGGGLADLWEISPLRIEENARHTEFIIDRLFPGNPLLCCGRSKSDFDTKPREDWRGQLSALQLIVPSPMSAVTGQTKNDKESKHTLANTGPRRFLIVEFDTGTTDEHAALLLHLGTFAPLVCVVHSGNKSLHGWFLVAGKLDARTCPR